MRSPHALAIGVALLWTAPVRAETLLEEDWDGPPEQIAAEWADNSCSDPAITPPAGPWPLASRPGLSTTHKISGNNSLRFQFTGHQQSHIDAGVRPSFGLPEWPVGQGCSATKRFSPVSEVWVTWYEYVVAGWESDEIGTKALRFYATAPGLDLAGSLTWLQQGRQLNFGLDSYDTPVNLLQNMAPFEMPFDKWVCYEGRLKFNNPGMKDGAYELYATEVTDQGARIQIANHPNREFRAPSPYVLHGPFGSDSKIYAIKMELQDGMGDIYRDKITVSTTPVGCGMAPLNDPPSAPKNLTVS